MGTLVSWVLLWVISAAVIVTTAYLLPGVQVRNFGTALMTAIVLGLVNIFIRPLILVFTLPINIFTLGLFTFVINALLILLVSSIVSDFKVKGFWNALLFSIIYSLIRLLIDAVFNI